MKAHANLNEVENKLYRLWTNREERSKYLTAAGETEVDDLTKSIDARGVRLYSSLIEIGRMDLMSSIFPVLKQLVGKQFKTLVLDYYEQLPPNHPNLNQAASRFAQYLPGVEKLIGRYPFIAELADYEWIELAVLEDCADCCAADVKFLQSEDPTPENFAVTVPIANNVFVGRRYKYAIPRLMQEIKDEQKMPRRFKQEPTCVVVYRDPESLDARFLEVGEVALTLLENIRDKPGITYGDLIKAVCSDPQFCGTQHGTDVGNLLNGCLQAIEQFKDLKLIVGERL